MRFVSAILLSIAAAYALSFYLTVPANPEIQFWREVVKRREVEIAQVRRNQPESPIIFFTGGSSTAFSIDPKIVEEICGLPSFNLGLPVAAGGEYLLHQALKQTRPGDFLIVCLEPDLLTYSSLPSPSSFGLAMATSAGCPSEAAGGATFGQSTSLRNYLNLFRPGPRHLATLGMKGVIGKGYRYTIEDIRYRGRVETMLHNPAMDPAGPMLATHLNTRGTNLLQTFQNAAEHMKVRIFYSMPWHFTDERHIVANRICKKAILDHIGLIIPVLEDDYAGSASDPRFFSDTAMHLSGSGSEIRSKTVANALYRASPQLHRSPE